MEGRRFEQRVFDVTSENFEGMALEVFRFQYQRNAVYKNYVDALRVNAAGVNTIGDIPFLPIRFFKTHKIISGDFTPQLTFESSGTTKTVNSLHFLKNSAVYEESFLRGFRLFYGDVADWCILGLLPSYLERKNSSLVYMVERLIRESRLGESGFYLNEFGRLADTLNLLEQKNQKTLLIGVTFALLDFAETHQFGLKNTIVMETGGMKGRREEMIRGQVHQTLKKAFGLQKIHSEYGMTELLSQAYSKGDGIFETPPWMRVLLRDEDDPLSIMKQCGKTRGLINVIDLANIYSCSFIATDDVGALYENNTFEVLGRRDNSDLRGCSLMVV